MIRTRDQRRNRGVYTIRKSATRTCLLVCPVLVLEMYDIFGGRAWRLCARSILGSGGLAVASSGIEKCSGSHYCCSLREMAVEVVVVDV